MSIYTDLQYNKSIYWRVSAILHKCKNNSALKL